MYSPWGMRLSYLLAKKAACTNAGIGGGGAPYRKCEGTNWTGCDIDLDDG